LFFSFISIVHNGSGQHPDQQCRNAYPKKNLQEIEKNK